MPINTTHTPARRSYILPGRFQPFHNDHLWVLRRALETCSPIYLGIVVATPTGSDASTPFEAEARRQQEPERNPFSPQQRLEMITACLHEELGERRNLVFPLLLPRPEANWNIINSMFPGSRTWIVPAVGEVFDEMKARFFESRGDAVMRVELKPSASGRELREAFARGSSDWEARVPAAIASFIRLALEEDSSDV